MYIIYKDEKMKMQLMNIFGDNFDISYKNTISEFENDCEKIEKKIKIIIMDTNELKQEDLKRIYQIMHMEAFSKTIFIGLMREQSSKIEEILFSIHFDEVVYESMTIETIKHRIMTSIRHKHLEHGIDDIYSGIIKTIAEEWGLEGGEHHDATRKYVKVILKYVQKKHPEQLTNDDIEMISYASMLHDIGKIAVPYEILSKPEKLTPEEFEEVKKHTLYGCELLRNTRNKDSHFYRYCYDIVRYHHERWDGSGYPDGLKGCDIPLCAQVVGMMDIFEALTSNKVYKRAIDKETAINMILSGKCGSFSNEMLNYLKESRSELLLI